MLVRRAHEPWRGAWDVPGGFCGPREHPTDAAEREVREETGLAVRVGECARDVDRHLRPRGRRRRQGDPQHLLPRDGADRRPSRGSTRTRWRRSAGSRRTSCPSDLAFPGHVPAVLRAWRESLEPAARPSASTLASAAASPPRAAPRPSPSASPSRPPPDPRETRVALGHDLLCLAPFGALPREGPGESRFPLAGETQPECSALACPVTLLGERRCRSIASRP